MTQGLFYDVPPTRAELHVCPPTRGRAQAARSLSRATAEHFGEPCFRVGKRIFASCGEKDGVWIDAAHVDDWEDVRTLVLESHRLNEPAKKSRKKTRKR